MERLGSLDPMTRLALVGLYGPNGTDERLWNGVPEADRPRLACTAMLRWQGENHRAFNSRLFREILKTVIADGEIREYMSLAAVRDPASKYAGEPPTKYESMGLDLSSRRAWFRNMAEYLRAWAYEHRDGRADTWTPDQREARDASGVWS